MPHRHVTGFALESDVFAQRLNWTGLVDTLRGAKTIQASKCTEQTTDKRIIPCQLNGGRHILNASCPRKALKWRRRRNRVDLQP